MKWYPFGQNFEITTYHLYCFGSKVQTAKIMTNTQRDIVKQKISDLLHEIKSDSHDGEQGPVEVKIEPGTENPAPKKPKLFASLLGDICDLTLPTSLD